MRRKPPFFKERKPLKELEPRERLMVLEEQHCAARFPAALARINLLLDAEIAECVTTFLKNEDLHVYRTATLGIRCCEANHIWSILYKEGEV